MRILLINQFFWPDSAATSQLLTDVARALSERGHDVEVLCACTPYAEPDRSNPPNVRISRFRSLPFGRSKIGRILSYASYLTAAGSAGLQSRKPDLVITLTTPPLVSLLGTLLKYTRGARHFSWEMDLYPDIVSDLGYMEAAHPVLRLIGSMADFSRRHADGVIALGECMKRRLVARGIKENHISVSENWADGALISPRPFQEDGKLKLLYSGNLGLGHDVDTFCQSMRDLRQDPRFQLVLAGGGSRHVQVRQFCRDHSLTSVFFRSYCARAVLGESLAEGDIGLVTQNLNSSGSIVPSKLYGILAAGRPVIYIGPRDSTPAQVIQRFRCGWIVDCGDRAALTALLKKLADHRDEVREAGARARQAFDEAYDVTAGTSRFCAVLFGEDLVPAVIPPTMPGSIAQMRDAYLGLEKKP